MRDDQQGFVGRRNDGWNRPEPAKQKKRRPFFIITVLMLISFGALYSYIFLYPSLNNQPSVSNVNEPVQSIIDSYPDFNVGVSLVDTQTKKRINIGEQSPFVAASTTKMLTAVLAMHEIEKGRLSFDKKFDGYPVSWHLQQIVNQSNSVSWATLNHYFGEDKMVSYAKSVGLNSYDYKKNLITPNDEATLLDKFYTGKLINKTHTNTLLGYMQHTNDDSFIPAVADTQDITVYHKYGWLESNIHDVGILKTKKTSWVVAIYTHPHNNEMDATTSRDIIQSITEVIVKNIENKT